MNCNEAAWFFAGVGGDISCPYDELQRSSVVLRPPLAVIYRVPTMTCNEVALFFIGLVPGCRIPTMNDNEVALFFAGVRVLWRLWSNHYPLIRYLSARLSHCLHRQMAVAQ